MYIEMTSFAIPTFLIKLGLVALGLIAVWFVVAVVGATVYSMSVERAIRKQAEIDAEIDRLHR